MRCLLDFVTLLLYFIILWRRLLWTFLVLARPDKLESNSFFFFFFLSISQSQRITINKINGKQKINYVETISRVHSHRIKKRMPFCFPIKSTRKGMNDAELHELTKILVNV